MPGAFRPPGEAVPAQAAQLAGSSAAAVRKLIFLAFQRPSRQRPPPSDGDRKIGPRTDDARWTDF
jgi:hypothetical protein